MQINPMHFLPIPGVTPMDGSAFATPQEKYLASGGGQSFQTMASGGPPAAGGVPGQGGGAPGQSSGGLMNAIMKIFAAGGGMGM